MKAKWLWIVLLVLMIVMVCGLIVSVLGMGLFSFRTISTGTNSPGSVVEQLFNGDIIGNNIISIETSEDKTFLTGSEEITLVVENRFGDVLVQGKETDEVFISVVKTAWGVTDEEASENLEMLQYEVIEEPGRLKIRVLEPQRNLNRPGSIDFKMDIPINSNIEFSTQNGDLYVANIEGNVDLNSSFGNIELKDVQNGEIFAETQNGNVTLRGINIQDFSLEANSAFGDIDVFQVDANRLNLKLTNGAMNLENIMIDGDIDLTNQFGSIGYRSGQTENLTINSSNGTITLNGITIEKILIAHTDFGNIDLSETKAVEYDLLTKNGRIDLKGANEAKIKAVTDFGDIELSNVVSSTLDLDTKNGAVTFNGSLALDNHRIFSDFGSITIRMPSTQSIDCDIKTGFGKIDSEFDITVSGSIEEKHLTGKINDGGGLLTIETQNGNITLEKTTVEEEE
jgi:DUF4097 and DUF4098 domain-containing protein YvlB